MKFGKRITKAVLAATLLLGLLTGGGFSAFAASDDNKQAQPTTEKANASKDVGKIKKVINTLPTIKEIPYGEGMTFHSEPTQLVILLVYV